MTEPDPPTATGNAGSLGNQRKARAGGQFMSYCGPGLCRYLCRDL